MKMRILYLLTLCCVLLIAAFGIVKRQTYTDLTKEDDYLEQLYVAELPEKFAIQTYQNLTASLPAAPVILRVSALEPVEHLFYSRHQKIQIEEVYAGKGLEKGQVIYLTSNHWSLVLDGEPNSIECGFVNIMNTESEYLVFISQKIDSLDKSMELYQLYDDSLISPVFCYDSKTNIIIPQEGETTYVPYSKVRDNEFFVTTKTALDALEKLKEEMLSAYPAS